MQIQLRHYPGLMLVVLPVSTGCVAPAPETPRFACASLTSAGGEGSFAVIAADLDGDGRLDLVVSQSDAGSVASFRNRGAGRMESAGRWPVGRVPRGLAAADFDGDGRLDVAVANASSHDITVLRGRGDGTLVPIDSPSKAGWAPFQLLAEDLDGDPHVDLIVVDESNWSDASRRGTVSLLRGNGDGTFRRTATLTAGIHPAYAVLVDLDRDGRQDLIVANWNAASLSVFRRTGPGSFAEATEVPVPDAAPTYGMAVADFDTDGHADLAVADVSGQLHLMRGDGSGGVRFWRSVAMAGAGTRDVVATDLDGDGRVDLVTADQHSHSLSMLLGRGAGEFSAPIALQVGRRPRSLTAADIDGDGMVDLIVANQGDDSVSVLRQTKGDAVDCHRERSRQAHADGPRSH